jgi:hypothetical protein
VGSAGAARRAPVTVAGRVSTVLGIEERRARALLAAMRSRLGRARYAARVLAFLAATTPVARVLPPDARRRAAQALVGRAVELPGDAMYYLGETDALGQDACRGLLRR